MKEGRDKILPSFWVPSMTPQSDKKPELKLPDQTVYCPMSGKPLRAKDLLPIVLTPIDKNLSREELITREVRKFSFIGRFHSRLILHLLNFS